MGKVLKDAIVGNHWFAIFSTVAILLVGISFILPPAGAVEPSALAGAGEIFLFASLWTVVKAIDNGHSAKITKGDATIEVKKED